MIVQAQAVIVRAAGTPGQVEEMIVDDPGPGEVLVRIEASGVCHTDLMYRNGDVDDRFPYLLGHEGAGVVEKAGPGVSGGGNPIGSGPYPRQRDGLSQLRRRNGAGSRRAAGVLHPRHLSGVHERVSDDVGLARVRPRRGEPADRGRDLAAVRACVRAHRAHARRGSMIATLLEGFALDPRVRASTEKLTTGEANPSASHLSFSQDPSQY